MSQLFMVQLSSTFEIIIIWISAIISLGLMTLSLGLRALEASKITICPTNVQITSILTLIFNIFVVYGQIGLCFGDDTPGGLCYHISWAHDSTKRFRGPQGP